jgi:membrane associated rhomboid family serine protease
MIPIRDDVPHTTTPWVNYFLIAMNTAVFVFELLLAPAARNEFIFQFGVVPSHTMAFLAGAQGMPAVVAFLPLLTSLFLHGGWFHIIGNMWFLWIFGDNIEDILGHGKYLLFYLACGAAAGLSQYIFNQDSQLPMVGASGAIAGVMGAYIVKFPHARVLALVTVIFFFTTIEVPAWIMLIFWFGTQFFNGVGAIAYSRASEGGVAFFAHVGGFIAGAALIALLAKQQPYTRRRDLSW